MRWCFLLAACLACGQPAFEAASIRPAAPLAEGQRGFRVRGGPGSSDPDLAMLTNIDLSSLIAMAYGLQRHQISGPDWLTTARFDIAVRIAEHTTPDDYRLMLQGLLAERFGLVQHRATKELQLYELEVAPGGLKVKELPAEPVDGVKPPPLYASLPVGFQGGRVNVVMTKATMQKAASVLSGVLGEPVIDSTGLGGAYDIKIQSMVRSQADDTDAAPDLFVALQEQVGLRLVRRKRSVEVLVVDAVNKAPSEN